MADEILGLGLDRPPRRPPLNVTRVVRATIRTIGSNLLYILLVTSVLNVPILMLREPRDLSPGKSEDFSAFVLFKFSSLLADLTAAAVLSADVFRYLLGNRPPSARDRWKACLAAARAIPIAILLAAATTVGLLLCIVPGAYVYASYVMGVPAAAVERLSPWAVLERAKVLTGEDRWSILGAFFVLGAITGVPIWIGTFLLRDQPGALRMWSGAGIIADGMFRATVVGVMYYHLRDSAEDLHTMNAAEVFD